MDIHIGECDQWKKPNKETYFVISIPKFLPKNLLDEPLVTRLIRSLITRKFDTMLNGSMYTETKLSVTLINQAFAENAETSQQSRTLIHGTMKFIQPTTSADSHAFILFDAQFEFSCAQYQFAKARYSIYQTKNTSWPYPED